MPAKRYNGHRSWNAWNVALWKGNTRINGKEYEIAPLGDETFAMLDFIERTATIRGWFDETKK